MRALRLSGHFWKLGSIASESLPTETTGGEILVAFWPKHGLRSGLSVPNFKKIFLGAACSQTFLPYLHLSKHIGCTRLALALHCTLIHSLKKGAVIILCAPNKAPLRVVIIFNDTLIKAFTVYRNRQVCQSPWCGCSSLIHVFFKEAGLSCQQNYGMIN